MTTTYDNLQVDIGNAPNDDAGDTLRTAFDKINQRFAELRVFLRNRGDWAPNTVYTANPNRDWVIVDGVGYLATSNHTSGVTFAADLAAGKWVEADAIQLRADLAQPDGAKHVGGVDLQLADYTALRAYAGTKTRVYITGALGTAKPAGIAGVFQRDHTDTTSADNGGTIIVGADGRRWKRDYSGMPMADWFGALKNGTYDDALAMNACISAHSACALGVGTYTIKSNVGSTVKSFVLQGAGIDETFLNCVSPNNDGRFGGNAANQAAVYSRGDNTFQPYGSTVNDLTINCNKLINATGSTGLKGLMFYKSYGCFANRVRVNFCASYAFWLASEENNAVRCSATFNDCEENNSEIGFETVNPKKAVFNNCNSYKDGSLQPYPQYNCFHAYGIQPDAVVQFNHCTGIGEASLVTGGGVSTVVELALICKNVEFNDCTLINKRVGMSAVSLYQATGDFDNIKFGNCTIQAAGPTALLNGGGVSTAARPKITFVGGSIVSTKADAITAQDNKATIELIGTEVESIAPDAGVFARCITELAAGTPIFVTGGSMYASGAGGQAVSNCTSINISSTTKLTPAVAGQQSIRQKAYGTTNIEADGSNSYKLIVLPGAVANQSKVVFTPSIRSSTPGSYINFPLSWGFLNSSEVIVRIVGNASAHNLTWSFVEYE